MTGEQQPVNMRAYRAALVAFCLAFAGGIVAAYGYWSDRTEVWLGLGLAVCLAGIGFGLVSWSKYLDFDEHVVQQRERLATTVEEQSSFQDIVDESASSVGRRPLLVALFAGSLGSLVVGFVGPIGSLGPKPRGERDHTGWGQGVRLVTADSAPIPFESDVFDQLATVFPNGAVGHDDSQVVLLRVRPDQLTERTRNAGTIDGWVAYSKICTHAGCSVGLFGIDTRPPGLIRQLVCPCHQSVFDPLDHGEPHGGPAPRRLPQLPLGVDSEGYLVALSDFDGPVGPLAWDEA